MSVIVQPLPMTPTLPINPYSNGSYHYGDINPNASGKTSNCNCQTQPNTYDAIQFCLRQMQGNLLSCKCPRRKKAPPPPVVTIPLRHNSPKLQPLLQLCRPERTPHGQILCQPLLTYSLQGHHGQFLPILMKSQHPPLSKQKRQRRRPHQKRQISSTP